MSEEQASAVPQATEPASETPSPAPAPIAVTDASSYAAAVRARVDSEVAKTEKPRGEDGKFKANEPKPAPEQADPAQEPPQSAEPDAPAEKPAEKKPAIKLDLAKKLEAEKARRLHEQQNKAQIEEFRKAQPLLSGLSRDKLGTVDELLTQEEFEALCDRRIARLNGKTPTSPVDIKNEVRQAITETMADQQKGQKDQAAELGKAHFGRLVADIAPKNPDFEAAKEWYSERGDDFTQICIDTADAILEAEKYLPTPEQARDTAIAYAMQELERADRINRKRATKPENKPEPEPEQKKKKTLNSTLRGASSRPSDIVVKDRVSYAELVKARVAAGK